MTAFSLNKFATLVALASMTVPFASAGHARRDNTTPKVFSIPLTAAPGDDVTLRVDMNGPATGDQVVAISTITPGNWSYLPSQVLVGAGQSYVLFHATVSPFANDYVCATATANGVSASAAASVVNDLKR